MTATVLAPDWRRICSCTVGTPFSRASERCSLVPSSAEPMSRMRIGAPLTVATTRSLNALRMRDASHGAQHLFLRAAGDIAAGDIGILTLDRVAHCGDRNLIGGQTVGVDPDIDGAFKTADDAHFADARPSVRAAL